MINNMRKPKKGFSPLVWIILILSSLILLTACGSSPDSRLEKVLDVGYTPICRTHPDDHDTSEEFLVLDEKDSTMRIIRITTTGTISRVTPVEGVKAYIE